MNAVVHLKAGKASTCGWIRKAEITDTIEILHKLNHDLQMILGLKFLFCCQNW